VEGIKLEVIELVWNGPFILILLFIIMLNFSLPSHSIHLGNKDVLGYLVSNIYMMEHCCIKRCRGIKILGNWCTGIWGCWDSRYWCIQRYGCWLTKILGHWDIEFQLIGRLGYQPSNDCIDTNRTWNGYQPMNNFPSHATKSQVIIYWDLANMCVEN